MSCIPSSSATPATAPAGPGRSCAAPSSARRSSGGPPAPARRRCLWLWWAGPAGLKLDLDLAWRAYIRRFDLEHTVGFAKQTLGWTIPRPRHPEQADRWTWLVLAAYTQLRMARDIASDRRLPWERPRPQPRLSPYRVRRGFRACCARWARRPPRRNPQALPGPPKWQQPRAGDPLPPDQEAH
jgi:hypothetical protein